MGEFVTLAAIIIGCALAYFGISCWMEYRRSKRQQEEYEAQLEIDRQDRHFAAQRERFHREREVSKTAELALSRRKFTSHAPNARATVLKMRKEEQVSDGFGTSGSAFIDAMILQSLLNAPSGYLDGSPEPTASAHGLLSGQGGTFDGGGSSGDWSPSSSDSGSSSSSSSDSSSSSSSDSGSSSGSGD